MRIVPEWKDYDSEIRNLMQKWSSDKKQNQSTPTVTVIIPDSSR